MRYVHYTTTEVYGQLSRREVPIAEAACLLSPGDRDKRGPAYDSLSLARPGQEFKVDDGCGYVVVLE